MMDPEILLRLKAHCRVDFDDDDLLLGLLYQAAVRYLERAGIAEAVEDEEYLLAAFSLVLEWYEAGSTVNVTIGTRQLINQLKLDAIGDGSL
ncbi:MAG: hypothetical protein E7434_01625 [Ruminococcaceae bacterium]|nr:hypothetical protein [Oscillospiraceae bacterium]